MRTSKKMLSFFLALVMVITSCSVGFTAFAADGNKTDPNLEYWNDATTADEAFDALNTLVGSLLTIDAIKDLLEDNNIVDKVDRRIDSSTRKYALYSPGRMIVMGLKIKIKK